MTSVEWPIILGRMWGHSLAKGGKNLMRLTIEQDIFLNSILPVLAGSCFYFMSFNVSLTGFWRNQLPDGLWAYSLVSSMLIIWNRQINIFWISIIFITFISFEALQHFHFINGTGDWMDIIIYFSFSAISLLTNKFLFHNKKNAPWQLALETFFPYLLFQFSSFSLWQVQA